MLSSASPGTRRVVLFAALLAVVLLMGFSTSAFAQSTGYDNIPDPMPLHSASQSFYSYGVDELGVHIQFATSARGTLQSVSAVVTN
ncbi:MAG: hypothetical protein ACRC1H_04205, partial [Caldilineaceae bacterium]